MNKNNYHSLNGLKLIVRFLDLCSKAITVWQGENSTSCKNKTQKNPEYTKRMPNNGDFNQEILRKLNTTKQLLNQKHNLIIINEDKIIITIIIEKADYVRKNYYVI